MRPAGITPVLTTVCWLAGAWGAAPGAEPTWPPRGEPVKLRVRRDTWVSGYGSEAAGNNGAAAKMKLKGLTEFSLFDIDPAGLKGKIITGALWHFHCASPKDPVLRATVSTVATPWVEGTGQGYQQQQGSACFRQAALGRRDWAQPGSTFIDAAFGRGHTLWRFADATAPDEKGWQTVAVDPDVVAARAAGLSHGFAAQDDVGCVWSYENDKFTWTWYPNRFVHSRHQGSFKPYLEVWTGVTDDVPPQPVEAVTVVTVGFPAGDALVKWATPPDRGPGRTLGFHVAYEAGGTKADVPRYLIPMAGRPGREVRMHLQDLPFRPGEKVKLSIRPVDSAGNVGLALTQTITVSDTPRLFKIEPADLKPFSPAEDLPRVAGLKVAVADLADKIHPTSGEMIPARPKGYLGGNHLWSARKKLVRLHSGRNEAVCFQVNLAGEAEKVDVKLAFDDAGLKPRIYRLDCVSTRAGNLPDVCVPLQGPFAVPFKDDPEAAGARNVSLLCEVYVPHAARPGPKKGTLTIASDAERLDLNVHLTVWDFTLPNKLSFIPEMNCYGTAGPTRQGLDYYRLAHEHRLCLNRLYYHWNGRVDFPPKWTDKGLDFSQWDKQFGPLLDGSAFKDLPRAGEPVDLFYLPFNEHWPMDLYAHYAKSYWADEAFTRAYKDGLRKAFAQMAAHCNEKGWHDTAFQFYLNNKVYNKRSGWKRTPAPWVFDEPVGTQDFWALRFYAILFHQAVAPVRGKAAMWFRGDVSRSQHARNMLWGLMDQVYMHATAQAVRMKRDEQVLWSKSHFSPYGSANDPAGSNLQPILWCLKAWSDGAIGLVPWQTIGKDENMSQGSNTGLFIPHAGGVVASVRVKAFRRGQQDVEYLTLLGDSRARPRYAVAAGMREMVSLAGRRLQAGAEDAGTLRFEKADAAALWLLRVSVGEMISAGKPPYKRCVRPMDLPARDVSRLPDIGYCRVAPKVPAATPR